jgi:hypothetical protein
MTLTESVYAAFVAGSPNLRVYPEVLPQKPLLPASVYTLIYLQEEEGIGGEDLGLVNAHLQVDTYALTQAEADSVSSLARSQLRASTDLQVNTSGGLWGYEADTRLYRVMREYSIWKNV